MKLHWILVLVFFMSLGIGLVPQGTCQNVNIADINVYPTISDIDFKNGIITFSNLYLSIDANESFIVYVFTSALPTPTLGDSRTTYDNGTGIYSLSQQEFSNGFQLKFSLGGYLTLVDDRMECGLAVGLNITSSLGEKNVYPSLDFPLQNDWDINATIIEATSQEASQYALYGMYAINQSMAISGLTQFYVVRIDITRKDSFNLNNFIFYWIPLILLFTLLFASLKLVIEGDLTNSLLVYISTAIFAFGYLSALRDITPPMVTSLEGFTLVDVSLSFIFSIISIFRRRPKEPKEQVRGSGMSEKEPKDEILELVRLVDKNKDSKGKPLFEERDIFSGSVRVLAGLSFFEILIWVMLRLGMISLVEFIALSFSLLAVFIAFLSLISQSEENIKIEARFRKALPLGPFFNKNHKPFTESQKLILKALIKIRSKHDKFSLEDIYKKNQDMFTERRLTEILYD